MPEKPQIGQGGYYKVYKSTPDRVLKIARREEKLSQEYARTRALCEFYISNILNLLFPDILPKVHFIGLGFDKKRRLSSTYIKPDLLQENIANAIVTGQISEELYEQLGKHISRVSNNQAIKDFLKMTNDLGISIDNTPQNFVYSVESKTFYYVDQIKVTTNTDTAKIKELILNNLSGFKQQRALKLFERFQKYFALL